MTCPLCGQRRARRACPALGHEICPVCCGTKRLTEIACPSGCVYLATARDHPPSVLLRQQERDVSLMLGYLRDFSERQSRLFLMVGTFLVQYQPSGMFPLVDDDVAAAVDSLAAAFETAARGVIYEPRPASAVADHLASTLKPLLADAGKGGGSAFERDASVVLRRLEQAAKGMATIEGNGRRALLELLERMIQKGDSRSPGAGGQPTASNLIVS